MRMSRKSGNAFSESFMLRQQLRRDRHSNLEDRALKA
jgi:hypothetical protein